MAKNLVIVESPSKASTIEKFLGTDYVVTSSYGHIRDLPKGNGAVDVENNFEPTYAITPDKTDVIKELKRMSKKAEMIWLATDDDREGEAISWHLKEALNLKEENTKRIVFREITKTAVVNAINNPRNIDMDVVNAQQARRILDRLVGFELSPILWKKIKGGLSAGRVQSVAVRIVVEREREIEKFETASSYKINGQFDLDNSKTLSATYKGKVENEDKAKEFLEKCIGAKFTIGNLEKKPGKKTPSAPFTTSTLQQEASRKLGYSVARTMQVAQKLYEAGHITYMRTDSTNLSGEAISKASTEIENAYGEEYVQVRKYKTKSENAQEAHEAIRPTNFSTHQISGEHARLYELIWKRAIASQMSDAKLEKTVATIDISTTSEKLVAEGQVIKFDGFLKVHFSSSEEDETQKKMLPPLSLNQVLDLAWLKGIERFSRSPARYTEATLVSKLEEMSIGRPSTFAPTISTIQRRNYVVKDNREGKERKFTVFTLIDDKILEKVETEITGTEKAKLFPTDTGISVNDFLVTYFESVVDYSFTANVEKELDDVAQGKKEWVQILSNFYPSFHEKVIAAEDIDRKEVNRARELGMHPDTGEMILVRLGKYGPFVQLGEPDDEKGIKPKYASLMRGQLIENITLEEAIELFKLPREVGDFEEKVMTVARGRFGPYIKHDSKFYSLKQPLDPHSVTHDEAIEVIKEKRKADAERIIKTWDENPDIQILKGRWGPYIKAGTKNVKIPKDKDPNELTLQECVDLADKEPEKKSKKKPAAKKAPAKKKPAAKKKAPAKKTVAKKPAAKKKAPAKKTATKKPAAKRKAPAKKTTEKD